MNSSPATLAIVAIVEKLAELGRKIHESFAKVSSNNFRNAQHVAWDIKEMITEIKAFCEDHVNTLEDIIDFHMALQGLLDKFKRFETSVLPRLSQEGRGKCSLIHGWRNNKKIEEHNKIDECIVDLQSGIVKVMWRYMLRSIMRSKAKKQSNWEENPQGVSQGTMTNPSIGPSGRNVERQSVMTDHEIEYEVRSMLQSLEMLRLPESVSNIAAEFQLAPMFEAASMSLGNLRYHVMRQITRIHDLLDPERALTAFVFYESSHSLSSLSVALQQLNLGHQSILVGNSAITLARSLTEAVSNRNSDRRADLAACLYRQSARHYRSGDKIQSLHAIDEAYAITRNLVNQHWVKVPFRILYSLVLTQYAEIVDDERSIKTTIEAVQVLEEILSTQAFTLSNLHEEIIIDSVIRPRFSLLQHLSKNSQAPTIIPAYALALQNLGVYLLRDGHDKCALDLQLLAIAIHRTMVSTHGYGYRVHLARALSSLIQGKTATSIPSDELVDMADECIEIFRELAGKNSLIYAEELVYMLQAKDRVLRTQEQGNHATAMGKGPVSPEYIILGAKVAYQEESGIHCVVASRDNSEALPPTWKESIGEDNCLNTDADMYSMTPSRKPSSFAQDDGAGDPTTNSPAEVHSSDASFTEVIPFSAEEGNHNSVAEKLAQLSITSFTTSNSTATTDYGSLFLAREL